jgi:hypothetical protein
MGDGAGGAAEATPQVNISKANRVGIASFFI